MRTILTILALFLVLAASSAQTPVTLSGPEGDTSTYIGKKILSHAYARLGIPLTVQELPAERSLNMANAGRTDGELLRLRAIEAAYPNLRLVPVPLYTMEGVVFARTLRIPITGWDSLRPYKVGIMRGIKFAEQGTQGLAVVVSNDARTMFRYLENGMIDLAVGARTAGLVEIHRLGYTDIVVLEKALVVNPMYHYLHQSRADLIPRLTAVLTEMNQSGKTEQLTREAVADLLK